MLTTETCFRYSESISDSMSNSMAACLVAISNKRHSICEKILTSDIYDQVINTASTGGFVHKNLLGEILDTYKYLPNIIKKDRNSSEQFKQRALFRDQPQTVTQIEKHYQMLSDRVQDKFRHMAKAYRFFDSDKVPHFYTLPDNQSGRMGLYCILSSNRH